MPIWHFATFRNIFQNAVKSRHVFLIQLDPHKDKYYTFWDPNFAFDNELFHNFFRFQLLNCKRRQQVSASFSCKLLFSSFSFGEKASQSYFTPSLLLSLWCSLFSLREITLQVKMKSSQQLPGAADWNLNWSLDSRSLLLLKQKSDALATSLNLNFQLSRTIHGGQIFYLKYLRNPPKQNLSSFSSFSCPVRARN